MKLLVLVLIGFLSLSFGSTRGRTVVSNDGRWEVEVDCVEGGLELAERFTLELKIKSAETGEVPSDLSLSVQARMPEHGHGMNVAPEVSKLGPGHFRAEGFRLHMPGYWELYFDISQGAVTERAQIIRVLE